MDNLKNQTPSSSPLLKAADVASMLKISKSLAYRLMQQGTIPTVRIHHSVRVRTSDLEQYIQNCWSGWASSTQTKE